MSIDKFTKEDFEAYLTSNHSPFQSLGLIEGEETYTLPLDDKISITVRSSIKSNGLSAGIASDSIRAWLVNGDRPLGIKTRTHRQPGWESRLNEKIKQLILWRALAGDCKECTQPKGIFRVAKDGDNKGRVFAKCNCAHSQKLKGNFVWLDEEESNDADEISRSQSESESELPKQTDNSLQELPKSPNPAQQSAIEADINSDLRVPAGPGSGKTFVIKHRYKFLIDSGINPQNIVVCTFGKNAVTEMARRILEACSQANLEQICTIHALCYRLLAKWYPDSRWYKWGGPKDWQVKKCLEDAIGIVWQEKEKPNAQEVYDFINTSKYLSLAVDDSYEWFVGALDQDRGEWLYEIRCKFDAWLNRSRFLTYADQLYLVEKRLQTDSEWRMMLQEKFTHVIVDEGQDTNFQAMRILVTLSLEPGMNTVYESEVK